MIASTSASAPRTSLPAYWVDVHAHANAPAPTRGWHKQLHAIAGALFSEDGHAPPKARLNWCVAQVDDLLIKVRGRGAFAYRVAVVAVSWLAPLLIFRMPRFARLSQEQRIQALQRVEQSPLKTLLFALKALLCIVYFEHPDAAEAIGFDGKGLLEVRDDV